jgi:ribonucleoside-diphosphate reductase alpha chain
MLTIKKCEKRYNVYDVTVEGVHNFYGNGIVAHNCQEISLPVKGFSSVDSGDGMIALCTLSSINWGALNDPSDLEKPCRMSIRALDNLLSYQEYPVVHAETFVKNFRALGIGIVGFAHFLAKRGLKYNIDAAAEVDKYMEAMAYYLTDESVRLAEERGACEMSDLTCYGQGIFPWELRNKNVDIVLAHETRFDWEELRERMKIHGIRNATLMAVAPTESSAQLLGETNGIEPPVAPVSVKSSKDGVLKTIVPSVHKLKNKYDYRWNQKNPRGYLTIMAVLQKWIDQTISTNTSYNPENYPDQQIRMSDLIKDFVFAKRMGLKTLYYDNTNDMSGEIEDKAETALQSSEPIEEVCDACNV